MKQLEALNVALAVLESHAKDYGDEECADAAGVIGEIIARYHRNKANRNNRQKAEELALTGAIYR